MTPEERHDEVITDSYRVDPDPPKNVAIDFGATNRIYTKEELINEAREWMSKEAVGCPREYYYTRFGVLVAFIDHVAR
jgi:hypothetical protein